MLTLKQFAGQILELREVQKMYFKTRAKNFLLLSMRLEKEVDDAVSEILKEEGK